MLEVISPSQDLHMIQNIWHAQHLAGSLLSDLADSDVLEFRQLREQAWVTWDSEIQNELLFCAEFEKSWKSNILWMDEEHK